MRDIRIMLSSHAHFDHVGGHAAMQQRTGARVMAIRQDAEALEAGMDKSPLGDEGWVPVKVDRALKDGDEVTLGWHDLARRRGQPRTIRPAARFWTTSVPDAGKTYSVAIFGCGGPNGGVKVVGNARLSDARRGHAGHVQQAEEAQAGPVRHGAPADAVCREDRAA